jgi:hypothetical protein
MTRFYEYCDEPSYPVFLTWLSNFQVLKEDPVQNTQLLYNNITVSH